ncbi:hypothetical protein FI667_g2636, partial [Globisporangium splendens]
MDASSSESADLGVGVTASGADAVSHMVTAPSSVSPDAGAGAAHVGESHPESLGDEHEHHEHGEHDDDDDDVHGDAASVAANAIDGKKTGRPVHPLWAHFHRGEKRNRYHYHAFCIYCVARYGAEHVAPTRGVSSDMLRHVEKCTNCPRKVVESIKDVCGRRDAVRFDRYLKKKSDSGEGDLQQELDGSVANGGEHASGEVHHHHQMQQQHRGHGQMSEATDMTQSEHFDPQSHHLQHYQPDHHGKEQQLMVEPNAGAEAADARLQHQHTDNISIQPPQTSNTDRDSSNTTMPHASMNGTSSHSSALPRSSTGGTSGSHSSHAHHLGKHSLRTAFESSHASESAGRHHVSLNARLQPEQQSNAVHGDTTHATKRLRASAAASSSRNSNFNRVAAMEWKTEMLQATVAAGLPFHAFENADFQELLQYMVPNIRDHTIPEMLMSIKDPHFLTDAASRLAQIQLDRVKQGMHNSTIKGGLTLSINCWSTLDLQQLVAFTLVNSNGESACVCVLDMGTTQSQTQTQDVPHTYSATQLAIEIEKVLVKLDSLRICVMGIVADSIVALNAARCVCYGMEKRQSLLVVPCFARQLSLLAGSLLTHARFHGAVGQMIEIASYFSNASLASVLKVVSGDDCARIPLPNRENWFSFLECITAMLKYCDVVTAICSSHSTAASSNSPEGELPGAVGVRIPHRLNKLVFADEGKLWKMLQELHTLLLPLKETYMLAFQHKAKCSNRDNDTSQQTTKDHHETEFAPAHGLTLAHLMYQLARMNQQYAGLVGTQHEALAQMMQTRLNATWHRYEMPVMVLAYVFNFHLDTSFLNTESATNAFQWDTIASYFQTYFSNWFQQQKRPPSGDGQGSNNDSGDGPNTLSIDKVHEIFRAYKTNQFPFDADTTSDYVDVSSFYSFVSDSHPEICALCCRMYAIALLSADVPRIVRGIGFVPTATTTLTTKQPESVELLLHVGFAPSVELFEHHRPRLEDGESAGRLSTTESDDPLTALNAIMGGCHPDEVFWNDDVWDEFATEWRSFLDHELQMDEFDAITQQLLHHHHTTTGTNEAELSLQLLPLLQGRKIPLDDVFRGTLAPLSTTGTAAPTATTRVSSGDPPRSTGNGNEDTEDDDTGVLSMEM